MDCLLVDKASFLIQPYNYGETSGTDETKRDRKHGIDRERERRERDDFVL